MFFVLVPVVFHYFKKELTFGPAFFAALALFSWVLHDYQYYACFQLAVTIGVISISIPIVKMGKEFFGKVLIVSGVFNAVLGLLQLCGVYVFFYPALAKDLHIPVGLMGNETVLAAFLAVAICPALWMGSLYSAFLMAIAIVATGSAMGAASLGAVAVLFLWDRKGFNWAASLCSAGLVFLGGFSLFNPDNPWLSFHGRWFIWGFSKRALLESPFFGSGIGSWVGHYIPLYANEFAKEWDHVPVQQHCDYLDFLVEYGFVAFAILCVAAVPFILRFKPSWTHAVCVSVLVGSLANFPLCLPPTAIAFVVCWAHSNRREKLLF